MDWRQIAAIWLLAVVLVGLAITGIILYQHRDRPAHAKPSAWRHLVSGAVLARWQQRAAAARERIAPGIGLWQITERPGAWNALDAWRDQVYAPLAIERQQAAQLAAARTAATAHAAITAGIPAADVATLVAADRAATTARINAYYRAAEELLTQALLDAGAARWH